MGIILCVLFLCFMVLSLIVFTACGMPIVILAMLLIYGALFALSLHMFLAGRNRRLEIDGDQLCSYTTTGYPNAFRASDIAGVSIAPLNGFSKLYGADGEVLFKFQRSMRNHSLLMQYLAEHHAPLRG